VTDWIVFATKTAACLLTKPEEEEESIRWWKLALIDQSIRTVPKQMIMKLPLYMIAISLILGTVVRASTTTTTDTRGRMLFQDIFTATASEAGEERGLRDSLPTDLSICDEYFFGRQTNLPPDEVPFCVNGGL